MGSPVDRVKFTHWVFNPLEVRASSHTSSHQTGYMSVLGRCMTWNEQLTILNPGIAKSVHALRLVFSNDAVAKGGAWKKVEDSIGIRALSLFIAEARGSRVPLHLAIEGRSSCDIDGIVGDDISLCNRECSDGEGKSVGRSGREISLGSVWLAFDLVLSFVDGSCLKQSRGDGGDGSSGELHIQVSGENSMSYGSG